jgi:hypothetical protein
MDASYDPKMRTLHYSEGRSVPDISVSAADKLTDQSLLSKVAIGSKSPYAREVAVKKLTDQTLLAKIAVLDENGAVRGDALSTIRDPSLLARLVTDDRVPREYRHWAFGPALRGTSVDLKKSVGRLDWPTHDVLEAIGRAQRAIADPIIVAHMPDLALDVTIEPVYASYSTGSKPGERVTFAVRRGASTLVTQQWTTEFHSPVYSLAFNPAEVDIAGMLGRLFGVADLTEEDVRKLSGSDVPEIRAGAIVHLQDQALLARIAMKDEAFPVRRVAVDKLTDQVALGQVAVAGQEDGRLEYVRSAAIAKLTDQVLLAKLAVEGHSEAFKRLTDQSILAQIATTAKYQGQRVEAVMRLTDQDVLAKVAVKDEDIYVREAAVERLTDQTLLANIVVEDKDSGVREKAKNRLDQVSIGK